MSLLPDNLHKRAPASLDVGKPELSDAEVESAVAGGLYAALEARREANEIFADDVFCDLLTRIYAAYALPTDVRGLAPSTLKKYERWISNSARSAGSR